ncbi:MAG TPA: proton-conducting transporter membrane subunit [Myxococcota bacterium]|jgi:NADH:ubiquinone oxidoreductase subunit 5 (subunit L)/multisubunit Na+/H+ antiporter MnhA subunit
MIELVDGSLFLTWGAPIAAALVVFSLARAPWLWARLVVAVAAQLGAAVLAVIVTAHICSRGGFAFVDIDGWVGARVTGVDPFGLVPSVVTPGTAPLLVAVELAGLLAALLLLPHALRARSSAPLSAVLFASGFCAMLVVARRLDGICAGFALAGVAGFALLVSFHPQRADVEGSVRAFLLHRAGDLLLLVAVFVVGACASNAGLDLERLPQQAPHIDAWTRAAAGPMSGFAAREIWLVLAALVALAAASRLALVVLLPLVRDAVGAPGAAVGLAHGVCFAGSGLILLQRMSAVLWLAPEVLTVLAWCGALGVIAAALFALAGRDLVRIDVHLLCAFAALGAIPFACADPATGAFAATLLLAAAVPLCAGTGVVVAATARADPHALGGLEKLLPRTHTARLLVTGALFGPIFSGTALAAHTIAAILFAPWIGGGPAVLLVVGLPLVAVAAFRPLHLAFTGTARQPLPQAVVEPSLTHTLPPLVLALPLLGLAVVHIPEGILALLPMATTYRSPVGSLLVPERALLRPLRLHVLPDFVHPSVHPATVTLAVIAALLLGYGASFALYRGGPGRLHHALFGGPRVQRAVGFLASLAGRESTVAYGIGESAERLSRLIATNLAPGVLDTLLRRIPTLIAALAGFAVRFIADGSAQRGLLTALVVLAILAVLAR